MLLAASCFLVYPLADEKNGQNCQKWLEIYRYIFLSVVRKTVRELLFEGYKDDVLEVGMDMSDYDEEGEVNMEKFGWFYDVSTMLIWRISVK